MLKIAPPGTVRASQVLVAAVLVGYLREAAKESIVQLFDEVSYQSAHFAEHTCQLLLVQMIFL